MILTRAIWAKVAAIAVTGGTAFALFGGGALHTQFSAQTHANSSVSGVNVSLRVHR
jgi:hypothetical protein